MTDYRLTSYAQPGTLTRVSDLNAYGQTAVICRDDLGRFWGVPSRYLKDGRLIRPLNGIIGNVSETLAQCLEETTRSFHMLSLVDAGEDPAVAALVAVQGVSLEEAREKLREALSSAKDNA